MTERESANGTKTLLFSLLYDFRVDGPTELPQPFGGLERKQTDNPGQVIRAERYYQICSIPPGSEGFTSSSAWNELTSTNRRRPTVVVMRCPVSITLTSLFARRP